MAMARITSLVGTLLDPSGKNPAPGPADAVTRAATPPGLPFSSDLDAPAAGTPAARFASGPSAASPPERLAGIRRQAQTTEPEDLAELINAVLVDQARRHGVDLS
jgi:hypothetical protein